MDQKELRACLGHFATGVAVVTARDPGWRRNGATINDAADEAEALGKQSYGATINSFVSVSMDPPLISVSFHKARTRGTAAARTALHRQRPLT